MPPLTQSYSFSSHMGSISSSQAVQNSTSNPAEGIRRVTIRQLLKAVELEGESAPFEIDGHPLRKVILVANLYENSSHTGTSSSGIINFGLDDGTGRIRGRRWALEKGEPTFDHFAYAHIVGELESYKGLRSIKITHMSPICDGIQIFHHILNVIFDTVAYEKGLPPPHLHQEILQSYLQTATRQYEVEGLTQNLHYTSISNSHDEPPATAPSSSGSSSTETVTRTVTLDPPPMNRYSNLTTLERVFLQCLSNREADSDDADGVHIEDFFPDVIAHVPDVTSATLCAAIDNLITHEFIATVDDEHYRRI